jgi:N6-adenosine-specific RNA methylase IME4
VSDYRLDLPQGQFGTIYADPPWRLSTGGVRRKLRYDSMDLDEIKALGERIQDICLPDAHLWLWSTNPHLPEAFEVVKAWGFTYKSLRTWDKGRIGLGWWLRSASEHLIFAVRSNRMRVQPGAYSTIFKGTYRGHSVKPAEAIECIEALSPPPRIELFARETRPDWTSLISDKPPVGDPYGQG